MIGRLPLDDREMRLLLRNKCALAGSQKAWAKAHRVSAAYVNDVLKGHRAVSAALAKKMGYRRSVLFFEEIE